MKAASSAMPAMPPTTPPAICPVFDFEWACDVDVDVDFGVPVVADGVPSGESFKPRTVRREQRTRRLEDVRKFKFSGFLWAELTASVLSRGGTPIVSLSGRNNKSRHQRRSKDKVAKKVSKHLYVEIRPVRHTRPGRNRVWISVGLEGSKKKQRFGKQGQSKFGRAPTWNWKITPQRYN
jgi:hypothetical protein